MTAKQPRYTVNGTICRYDRGVQSVTTRYKGTRYQVLYYRSLFYLVECGQSDTDTILSSGNRAAMMDAYFQKIGRKQNA